MSREIDIRNLQSESPITVIRFAERNFTEQPSHRQADIISKSDGCIKIYESGNADYVRIWNLKEAENFKKALDKAIELGWLK